MVNGFRHFVFGVWSLALLIYAGASFAYQAGYRLNTTASMPAGVYLTTKLKTEPLHRGAVVTVCPTPSGVFDLAFHRHYIGPGSCPGGREPLIKPVVALPMDDVAIRSDGVHVNGQLLANSKSRTADSLGRSIPVMPIGRYRVPPGQVWLISSHSAKSFDSRYFGPISINSIQHIAMPVFVW